MTTASTVSEQAALAESKITITIGYYLAFIALGLAASVVGPTLPDLANNTHSELSQISFLFTARSLGYIMGSLLGGRLYDRLPGHRVMPAFLLCMALALGLTPVIPLLWLLVGLMLLLGISEGTVDMGANTLLVWVHRDKVGPFMNGLHFFFGLGAFVAPIVVAQAILLGGDFRWGYWVLALLPLPAAFWLVRLPNPKPQAVGQGEPRPPAQLALVALITIFLFLYVAAEVSYGGWVYTYAVKLNLASEAVGAYLTSLFWGALTVGRLLAIPIAARSAPRGMLFADLIGCLASVGLILLLPGSSLALWAGTFGLGLFMASVFPTAISFAERHMHVTGSVSAWFFVGGGAGGMTMPWLVGQFFERSGPQITMFAVLACLLAALGVLAALLRSAARPAPM